MLLNFEYGAGTIAAELPDTTDVFIPGETIPDPPFLTDVVAQTRHSIQNPIGMPPISELAGPSSKVTIVFPDKVKGGFQEDSHRKVAIPLLLAECYAAGVQKKNITLICSNGLHRKNTEEELRKILGPHVYHEFHELNQLRNHDSEDWSDLVDLGKDPQGNPVIMNKTVFESDLAIMVGHVLGNPYGGYSGGYKHSATGITHWRSIASHHAPHVMHRQDFTPVSHQSLMRRKFDSISQHMESRMGKKFFMCDAVLDSVQRQIAVFSGYAEAIQPLSWKVADTRTYLPWAEKKYDVMVFGLPQNFHYGNGHGTNPILIQQAIAANIVRHRRILSDRFVVIAASLCNGFFHDEEFTAYRDLYNLFQKDAHQTLPEMARYGELFALKPEYINAYRFGYGFHPFHAFSMVSCGHIAEKEAAAVYVTGAEEPGYARSMGMKTRTTIEEALADARKIVGDNPSILALPKTFKLAGVHLMMKEGDSSCRMCH